MSKSNLLRLLIGVLAFILIVYTKDIRSLWVFLAIAYFLPSFVSEIRNKRKKGAILLFNLILGWTIWGWMGERRMLAPISSIHGFRICIAFSRITCFVKAGKSHLLLCA
jgi:hypothetical protein